MIAIKPMRRPAALASLAFAVSLSAQVPAAGQPHGELYVVCDMFATRIPVPVERVDPYIPDDGYTIQQIGGFAVVQPVAAHCDFPDLDGPGSTMDYSVIGVPLDRPADGGYDLWEVSDSSAWHTINARFGKYSPMVPGITFDVETIGAGVVRIHQDVPWRRSPYTLEAVVTPGAAAPPDIHFLSHHYGRGPHGDVYRQDDNFAIGAAGAVMTIDAAPGSELATMLGAEHVTLPGAFLHFEANDTWTIVDL